MLQVKNIHKEYKLGELNQVALNSVSLDLRDSEFVSILGPSGSGKTTLLNIIGGLDKYDDGDLIINGVSTKNYKDRDWDTYRNHTIGFIFQSYNLIGHQTILSNVELALTIGGVSKADRKKRAKEALVKVGLKDHISKKPNQLSGGQMQRVAIARALVNDPDILLADEPTGALDTETSVQIMELLKEVAKEKLVVMVTHNPELAEEYSTRIIKLKDGNIVGDTNPYKAENKIAEATARNNKKLSKMKRLTTFALSLSNLNTKKKRTLLTAFAGSIGIIGIALILSLSNGVNAYINDLQKDTMASYPITISAESIDMSAAMGAGPIGVPAGDDELSSDEIHADFGNLESANNMTITNNLTPFKVYLDDENSEIAQYLGEEGVQYSYDTSFSVYTYDKDEEFINTDTDASELLDNSNDMMAMMGGAGDPTQMMSMMSGGGSSNGAENFSQITPSSDGSPINDAVYDNYDMINGDWPQNYDEVLLVLDENNSVSAETLYQLGLITGDEYEEYAQLIEDGEETPEINFSYEDALNQSFYLLTNSDKYLENDEGRFVLTEEENIVTTDEVMDRAQELKIVGVIAPKEEAADASLQTSIAYTSLLTDYIIETSNESDVIKAQEENPEVNVITSVAFEAEDDAEKIDTTIEFLGNLNTANKADMYSLVMYYSSQNEEETEETTEESQQQMPAQTAQAPEMDDETMAMMLDTWVAETPDEQVLLQIHKDFLGESSYEENLNKFGKVNYDTPSAINIYSDSFEGKDGITLSIENYNATQDEENQIVYVDYVESLTSAMTTMVDTVSYVLIAFVAVSLVVSCIMVGIITHISVIERTREIGVLRALGASKRNISQVFNAETFIIGLCSGLIGIGATILINIPVNAIIANLVGNTSVSVGLQWEAALVLMAISVVVTVIGGLLPSKKAAQKDPVLALRSE